MKNQDSLRELYLATVRDSLTGKLCGDGKQPRVWWRYLARLAGLRCEVPMPDEERRLGLSWPSRALTMVGEERLDNVRRCVESALEDGVQGCWAECGVWRGGASIYATAVMASLGVRREMFLCDSFRGLPFPDRGARLLDLHWTFKDVLSVPASEVERNFRAYGLWHNRVRLVEGWFKDTLPLMGCGPVAVLRADGDMYSSTLDILRSLHRKVSPGGYVIVDDYHAVAECKRAVDQFREEEGVEWPMVPVDRSGVFWRVKK